MSSSSLSNSDSIEQSQSQSQQQQSMNKMLILLPVLFFTSKYIDGDDPYTITMLRYTYGIVQSICLLFIIYVYFMASSMISTTTTTTTNSSHHNDDDDDAKKKKDDDHVVVDNKETKKKNNNNNMTDVTVYVPVPPMPFDMSSIATTDDNDNENKNNKKKKKYNEVKFSVHVLSTTRTLLGSTLMGILITTALHYYRGMTTGLAIQSIMGPMNLYENPIIRTIIIQIFNFQRNSNSSTRTGGNGTTTTTTSLLSVLISPKLAAMTFLQPKFKMFDEKTANELTADDEIVDEQGNPIESSSSSTTTTNKRKDDDDDDDAPRTFEEVLLDTWDDGVSKANVSTLMKHVNESNVNYQTKENGWTVLMIMSGLSNVRGVGSAMRQLFTQYSTQIDLSIVDHDGWNAYHWAAFHNNIEAAKTLIRCANHNTSNSNKSSLSSLVTVMKSKEGQTPLETAKKENNIEIVKIYEDALTTTMK